MTAPDEPVDAETTLDEPEGESPLEKRIREYGAKAPLSDPSSHGLNAAAAEIPSTDWLAARRAAATLPGGLPGTGPGIASQPSHDAPPYAGWSRPVASPATTTVRGSRTGRSLAVLLVAVAIVVATGSAFVAVTNKKRADRWQQRYAQLGDQARQLNYLLVDRTQKLNVRARQLNTLAAKVTAATADLHRSEGDVASLSARQRQLANEKAQVEDQRQAVQQQADALATIAADFITCKQGLLDLLDYATSQDWIDAGAIVDTVSSDCSTAESDLSAYNSSYGG